MQVARIARAPEFMQLVEDLVVVLLGTGRNFRWSAHRLLLLCARMLHARHIFDIAQVLPGSRSDGRQAVLISRWFGLTVFQTCGAQGRADMVVRRQAHRLSHFAETFH